MARVSATTRSRNPMDPVAVQVQEYVTLRDEIERLEVRQKELRDALMETIEAVGISDDQGHRWLELDDVEGVAALQARRRVSRSLNTERALSILEENDLSDRCTRLVREVDEDEVMGCLYDELLSDEDVDSMFDEKVVWALHLKR